MFGSIGSTAPTTDAHTGPAPSSPVPGEVAPVTTTTTVPRTTAPVAAVGPVVGPTPPERITRVSWYGSESGSRTANGEPFTGNDLTFAHKTMAFGSLVRFCHEGSCVVARCNDRGPFIAGRLFDLSRAAFAAIAPIGTGVISVTWEPA